MAATSRQNPYYYISQAAITINPNAVDGDPSFVAVSVVTGTLIMLSVKHYQKYIDIDYNAKQENPTWRLSGYSTKLQEEYADKQVYIYARLVADAYNGLLVFADDDYTTITVDGSTSDPGIAKKNNYIYVKLGYLTAPYDGRRDINWDSGCLLTQYAEDTKDEFGELFKLVNDLIVPMKSFSELTVNGLLTALNGLKVNGKWTFNNYEIANLRNYADYEKQLNTVISATEDLDKYLPSMRLIFSYINNHLRKDIADTAKGKITFAQGVNIDNQDITSVDVESDVPDGGMTDAEDTSIPTTAAMVKHTQEHGDANYLSKVKDDTAKGKITFEKGLKIGNFTPGVTDGTGGAMEISEEGVVTTTTDYLNVRRKARFNEVEILTTHHIGGAQMSSAASCKIDHVVTRVDGVYPCFFRKTDADGRIITNDWKKGDQAYCNTFNLQKQADGTKGNHYFWRLVVSTAAVTGILTSDLGETFDASEYHCAWLSRNDCAEGSDAPQAGDEVVLLGHQPQSGETEADYAGRQSAIYQVASGTDGRPYYRQYVGINSFSLDGCLEQQMMPNDNIFKGSMTITGGKAREELDSKATLSELSYSASNLLRNTGFYGDGKSAQISDEQWINVDEEMMSPSLLYWTVEQGEQEVVSDTDSASGYSISVGKNNVISQDVENCIAGENYILSLKLKGTCQFEFGGAEIYLMNDTDQYVRISHSFKAINDNNKFTIRTENYYCQICELMLERGTIPSNNWQRSIQDVNPEIIRVQNLQYLADAMQKGQTDILGGLILTNMIQLGKPKSTGDALTADEVTCGINGNNIKGDNAVAIWGGGTWNQARETASAFVNNPQFQPTEAELADMAKFVITHGGLAILNDAIVRGTVFATNGRFTGEVNATSGTFENGTFKNVVINGTYNKLFQTINATNASQFFKAYDTKYYPYLLSWGDGMRLEAGTPEPWMLPCINPYIDFDDNGNGILTSAVNGYKKDGTQMSLDEVRSLIGRKIIIYNYSEKKITFYADCWKNISDHATNDMVYRTDTPYTSDKQYDDEATGKREPWHIAEPFDEDYPNNETFALTAGKAAILECMLGEKYISNRDVAYTSEMVFWTIRDMDIIQQRVDIDNKN